MNENLDAKIVSEVERQLKILRRGCEEIISENEFKERLYNSIKSGTPLKIKFGIDPTGDSIHIGHAVVMRKLREFQDLGHEIQFLIGSYTARIGDPTGKSETRKVLTDQDIQHNMKNYMRHIGKILDISKLKVVYNHAWLEQLTMEDILKLMSQFTVSLMTSREDFSKRLSENKPISLVEFMYPILQGYDSVALHCDVELGGTEQKFNVLRGRDLQKAYGQLPQICMILPILEGTDGKNKMSKSLNNYISVEEDLNDMYGKVMSIPDEIMGRYMRLTTNLSDEEINDIERNLVAGTVHPMDVKRRVAREVVSIYYSSEKAIVAENYFSELFSKRSIPQDIAEIKLEHATIEIIPLLVEKLNFSKTTSDARRLIQQGAISINGEKIEDVKAVILLESGMIIKAGKKNIVKIK
ncbi:MAG: tyrosine--tRNA ligase [Fusobacteria bacterium]|nr:tyrosine--tRNA ligase [Fusobacteriota bacterium]